MVSSILTTHSPNVQSLKKNLGQVLFLSEEGTTKTANTVLHLAVQRFKVFEFQSQCKQVHLAHFLFFESRRRIHLKLTEVHVDLYERTQLNQTALIGMLCPGY